jgi:DNA invertase Pin-like site-specific DNA recombinase
MSEERFALMVGEEMSPHPNAVGYVRTAVGDPDSLSLEAQAEAIREYCHARGWRLIRIYSDPDLVASHEGAPPGLRQLLQDVASGEIRYVVVKRLSRLGRKLGDLIALLEELARRGVVVVSVDDDLESSETLMRLLVAVDDLSRSLLRERIRVALRAAKQRGKHLGAVPLGMSRAPDGRLVDVGRSELARELRARLQQGYSLARAARELGVAYSTAWRLLRSSGDDSP